MVQPGDQSVWWLRILRRLLLLAQFLNSSQQLYLGGTRPNVDGSRTNTNANPFDGKCPLELQTKPLLLNCLIWGHRGRQGSGELTFHTRAMDTVRTGKLLLRSRSAPVHTLDVYNCLRNPHRFFTLQPHNRGQEQTNSDQLDGKQKGKNSHGSIITSVSIPSKRLPDPSSNKDRHWSNTSLMETGLFAILEKSGNLIPLVI